MLLLCRGCLDAFDALKFQLWPWLRAGSLPLLFPSLSTSIMGEPRALLVTGTTSSSSRMKELMDGKGRRWGRMAKHLGEVKFSFITSGACRQQLESCLVLRASLARLPLEMVSADGWSWALQAGKATRTAAKGKGAGSG